MDRRADDVHGEVAYALRTVQEFVARLKQLGVYDNSLVIVMSEHGYNYLHDMSSLPGDSGYFLVPFGTGHYVGQYEPLLMVKVPGAHGRLRYDETALTLLDLRKTLREFASPGSGEGMYGVNFLADTEGNRFRDVPVVRFTGTRFDGSKDFTSLEHWQRDTLHLPFDLNYGPSFSGRSPDEISTSPGRTESDSGN
jgi:arylsulfatase A-like enzyme